MTGLIYMHAGSCTFRVLHPRPYIEANKIGALLIYRIGTFLFFSRTDNREASCLAPTGAANYCCAPSHGVFQVCVFDTVRGSERLSVQRQ